MKQKLLKTLAPLFFAIILMGSANGAPFDWTVSLTPAEQLYNNAGTTAAWGYQITNLDDSAWLVLMNLNAGIFLNGTPAATFDFPILAPLASTSGNLYELQWDLTAPYGFTNAGTFDFTADFYDGDPTIGGSFLQAAPDKSVSYSATVVPEPSTVTLVGVAGGLLAWLSARRRSGASS